MRPRPTPMPTMTSMTATTLTGNTVYGYTQYQYYRVCHGDSSASYCTFYGRSTNEFEGPGLFEQRLSRSHVGDATKVRMKSKACAQLGWPTPDSCTVDSYWLHVYG